MTTAVVKFDALSDAIRTTAQDHDSLLVTLVRHLVFIFVGAVIVGCVRFEFRRACINGLESSHDAQLLAMGTHLHFIAR